MDSSISRQLRVWPWEKLSLPVSFSPSGFLFLCIDASRVALRTNPVSAI